MCPEHEDEHHCDNEHPGPDPVAEETVAEETVAVEAVAVEAVAEDPVANISDTEPWSPSPEEVDRLHHMERAIDARLFDGPTIYWDPDTTVTMHMSSLCNRDLNDRYPTLEHTSAITFWLKRERASFLYNIDSFPVETQLQWFDLWMGDLYEVLDAFLATGQTGHPDTGVEFGRRCPGWPDPCDEPTNCPHRNLGYYSVHCGYLCEDCYTGY